MYHQEKSIDFVDQIKMIEKAQVSAVVVFASSLKFWSRDPAAGYTPLKTRVKSNNKNRK